MKRNSPHKRKQKEKPTASKLTQQLQILRLEDDESARIDAKISNSGSTVLSLQPKCPTNSDIEKTKAISYHFHKDNTVAPITMSNLSSNNESDHFKMKYYAKSSTLSNKRNAEGVRITSRKRTKSINESTSSINMHMPENDEKKAHSIDVKEKVRHLKRWKSNDSVHSRYSTAKIQKSQQDSYKGQRSHKAQARDSLLKWKTESNPTDIEATTVGMGVKSSIVSGESSLSHNPRFLQTSVLLRRDNLTLEVEKSFKVIPITNQSPVRSSLLFSTSQQNYAVGKSSKNDQGTIIATESRFGNPEYASLSSKDTQTQNQTANECPYSALKCYQLDVRKLRSPPQSLEGSLKEMFIEQEEERYRLSQQHRIQITRFFQCVQQEVDRERVRSARAISNKRTPEEIEDYKDKKVQTRCNGRLLQLTLQDLYDKWKKTKKNILMRHNHEANSLHGVQKLEWKWKMELLGMCDNKSPPIIQDMYVPIVYVSDDFDIHCEE